MQVLLILTDFTPMNPRMGFARNISNTVWRRPSTPPTTSAVDAEGICRLSGLCFPSVADFLVTGEDLHEAVLKSD